MKSIYTLLILSFLATFVPADEITGLNLRTTAGSQAVNPTAVAGAVLSLDANKRPTFGGPLSVSGSDLLVPAGTFIRPSGAQPNGGLGFGESKFGEAQLYMQWLNAADVSLSTGRYLSGYSWIALNNRSVFGWVDATDITVHAPTLALSLEMDSPGILQLGNDAAGATTQTIKSADRITSDGVGSDLVIQAGNGRGAAGGSLIFKTSPAGGAGVTGTPATTMTINSAGVATFASSAIVMSNLRVGYGDYTSPLILGQGDKVILLQDVLGSPDLQLGADHATTPTAQTLKAHDVTTGTGASMTIAGGNGSVAGGDARIGTSVTNGAPNPRILVAAAEKTLTESTATIVCNVTVAAGKYIGGELIVTTHADDATDFQAITEHLTFSAVNKGGTVTATIQAAPSTSTTAASAGTLTTAWTAVANGNSVDIKNDAASSLTQTTLKCSYQLRLNTDDTVTVTP